MSSISIKPPENVYRKPYEFVSATVFALGAIGLLFIPLPLFSTLPILLILLALMVRRIMQGKRIHKFRKQLKVLPFYAATPDEVPLSNKALFLGKGFAWEQIHTQRLLMARLPENIHLTKVGKLYKWARKREILGKTDFFTKFLGSRSVLNPVKPLPPVGGFSELHGVEIVEEDIYQQLAERVGHTVVLGTTRVGKTRLAEILIGQDIRRGDTVIAFDPKGDADLMLSMYIAANKANRPFYMFHLGYPDISCRYNPIGDYSRVTEVATRIANGLPSEGQSAAFRDFVWRFVNVLAKLFEELNLKPCYQEIYNAAVKVDDYSVRYFKSILNKECPGWQNEFQNFDLSDSERKVMSRTGRSEEASLLSSFVKYKNIQDPTAISISGILGNEKSYFEKLVSSLYPLLEKLTTGKVAELLSPDTDNLLDNRQIMDWRKVMEQHAVVYVGLDALTDKEVARNVGNAMFADLTSLAGQIYKFGQGYGQSGVGVKHKLALHADEFNELIGDEFIPMLNKAGGANYQVVAYTQTWADVEAQLGNKSKALQMAGNFNTMIMLRVLTKNTAEMLTERLPEVRVVTGTLVSGAGDIAEIGKKEDFTSRNEDRISSETVPMLAPSDLCNLPKGQCFALLDGGHLYKIRLPLPKPDPAPNVPTNIWEVAADMREKYALYIADVEQNNLNPFVEGKSYAMSSFQANAIAAA